MIFFCFDGKINFWTLSWCTKSCQGDFMDMSGDYMDEPMIFVDESGQILNK